jgi:hypothetical protein
MDGLWMNWVLAQAQPAAAGRAVGWQFFVIVATVFILQFVLGQVLD